MKKLLKASKFVMKTLRADSNVSLLSPVAQSGPIENPDLKLSISHQIINELLSQNFPFETTIPIDETKQVKIAVTDGEVRTMPNNLLELRITNATLHFDRTVFKIGITSNTVALRLIPEIKEYEGEFKLRVQAEFSAFDIKHMPSWLEKIFIEVVRQKFLSPLIDVRINDFLTFDEAIETGVVPLKLALKPDKIAIRISEKGISLQMRFSKLVQ